MESWLETHARAVGWATFAATFLLVGLTLRDPGIVWDEPYYFGSAQLQAKLATLLVTDPAAALDRETVFEMWDWEHYFNPHPPVAREAMALTWWSARRVVGDLAAYRLAPALLFAGLVMLAFRWATAAWGGIAGLGAALSIVLMPRLFGHAHRATETPLLALWTAASAAGWWALERRHPRGWILVGVAWGLAAGTKFPGLLAIVPLAAWGLWRDPRATVRGLPRAALVGAVVFWALNPMLWFDPQLFLGRWLWRAFTAASTRRSRPSYLGESYSASVPRHYAIVMTRP
jgi:4-amino-4-deoxy-L-arabinose transferase-like glycosyltransferase